MKKYRVIYNGDKYRIQSRPWWFPIWSTYEPSRYRYMAAGYEPIDWSKYIFDTKEQAKERIEELKQLEEQCKWNVVEYE